MEEETHIYGRTTGNSCIYDNSGAYLLCLCSYKTLAGDTTSGLSFMSPTNPAVQYGAGGYTTFIRMSPTQNATTAKQHIQKLEDQNWFDSQTRAVFIEYTIFNPVTSVMVSVTVCIEQDANGRIQPAPFFMAVTGNSFDDKFWVNGFGRGNRAALWSWSLLAFMFQFISQEWIELKAVGCRNYIQNPWNIFDVSVPTFSVPVVYLLFVNLFVSS